MIDLNRRGDVFVLSLGDADNRFDDTTVGALDAAIAEVEAAPAPAALVTVASGKVWFNGLDLDHVAGLGEEAGAFLVEVQRLFGRLLELPLLTIAAIQGHCFGGGAMLAMAHDVRVMRIDRGYFCLPEVDFGLSFLDPMALLLGAKLPQPALHRLAVLGERLDGPTAVAYGVADNAVGEAEVVSTALDRAERLAPKAGPAVTELRRNFYQEAIEALAHRDHT